MLPGLLFVIACTEHGQTPQAQDATDPAVCEAAFEASIDRACTVPSDCVLVSHDDCCGVVEFGVSSANSGSFPGAEAELRRCAPCPPLGCAHPDFAEDGRAPQMGQAIVTTCVANRCSSIVQ